MPKMKHLLRKLHIGGGINEHQRLEEVGRPEISSPSPTDLSPVAESTPFASSGSGSDGLGRTDAAESAGDDVDFGLLEEEFQMQLAMAISASEPETAQIDSAKRISLAGGNNNVLAEFLSLRYWSHNVINYDEKIMDGFYDVCGITSSSVSQGKMPSLVDLQAISVSDNVHYEVVLVNRLLDHKLQELEKQVYDEYLEHYAMVQGSNLGGFIQKIACLVVDRLGGPVGDAEVMTRMWTLRSVELRNSLDTIILPLGHLDVGISRHRALLFKVLADRIGLPCLLVKGSYYTGTDDGAVNLIKIDGESEYIIDLMGAPGALIPVEVPSSHLPNSGSLLRCFADDTETPKDASLLHSKGAVNKSIPPLIDLFPKAETLGLGEAIIGGNGANEDGTNLSGNSSSGASEHELGKIVPVPGSGEGSSSNHVKPSSLQKRKVKNVSKYVISASKDPGFAQKLHAVLLESGASPPPDLFLNINSHDMGESNTMDQTVQEKGSSVDKDFLFRAKNFFSNQGPSFVSSGCEPVNSFNHNIAGKPASLQQKELDVVPTESKVSSPFDITGENALVTEDRRIQRISGNKSSGKESAAESRAASKSVMHISGGRMSREVAECEIDWEDLQIGERIGIGSYGEVYHGEWNGTEVAVKKFLDQDLTGDALVQLKCEIEIMLRLRHPNVVLFMGAVFRSPHLSILTEFLPRGSLYKILHRPVPPLDEKRRMRMALDVAKGMNYLHTSHPPIVHRDLKSPNLLVDRNWVVKVCDFGLSRLKHHTFLSSKSTAGTPEWMAPEVLRNEPANEKCDVYSFGVILWELITLRIPWKGLNPMQVVGAVGFQNRRLEIPDDVDPAVAQIIRECFITEPHLRPSFAQLTARLRHLQRQYIERSHSGNQNTE